MGRGESTSAVSDGLSRSLSWIIFSMRQGQLLRRPGHWDTHRRGLGCRRSSLGCKQTILQVTGGLEVAEELFTAFRDSGLEFFAAGGIAGQLDRLLDELSGAPG